MRARIRHWPPGVTESRVPPGIGSRIADALAQAGAKLVDAATGPYDAAFVRLQRQRQRHLGALARALAALKPGGMYWPCAGPMRWAARSLADDLAEMGVEGKSTSKHKCRLVVAARPAKLDLARFVDLDAPRDDGLRSAPKARRAYSPGTGSIPARRCCWKRLPPLTGPHRRSGGGLGGAGPRDPGAQSRHHARRLRGRRGGDRVSCAPICQASRRIGTT